MKTESYPRMESPFAEANEGQKHRPETKPYSRVTSGGSPCIPLRCLCYLLFHPLRHVVLALAAMGLLSSAAAQAQGAIEAWVQRYNGPENGDDQARAMVVDASGNVYVTGSSVGGDPPSGSSSDYLTIKYSSAGVPLWTNRYNGPGNFLDIATAVAVDASGNVVVTGSSTDSDRAPDYLTIKYSSEGMPLWTNRGPVGNAVAVAIDPSGNVVVTGLSTDNYYVTIKYSSAGAVVWTRQYSGSGALNSLAVDASGNVIVTGGSPGTGFRDYGTVKYSSAGGQLWLKWYNGPANGDDTPGAVAVDATGDVYVTGGSPGLIDNWDYATIKYSSAGTPLWTNRYAGPGNGSDSARAIAVDTGGDVYVTGLSTDDYATIKYSSAGTPLWTNRYNGPGSSGDEATAMAVDASGNVFVTGKSTGTGSGWDYATVAYTSSGVPLWTNRYNGSGNDWDWPKALAVDASGNVYVTGESATTNSYPHYYDYVTIKYVVPPIITRQPLSRTNAAGTTASFTVEVAGSRPFTYQWRRQGTNLLDGLNLSGVTTTNLLITNVQLADAAGYSVLVTNAYGSVTSSVAQLTVINPGRFTQLRYSPEMGFSFIFRDATIGLPVRIQRSSSLAEGSWSNWQSFTYTEPSYFLDMGATGAERRFYRAVSP